MTAETFGQMLRRLRTERGLSQNALARLASIDPAYVNRLERSGPGSAIGRAVVLALASALETSYAERDRLLYLAGLAPELDWQARCEEAEAALQAVRDAVGALNTAVEPIQLTRRTA